MQVIHLFNTKVHNLSMQETLSCIDMAIRDDNQILYADLNASKIVDMQSDERLLQSVNEADIINADGQAVIWASKIFKTPIKERVTGVDLMGELMALAAQKKYKVYLFGAKEEVVSKLKKQYEDLYGKDLIVGYRNGYFTKEEEPQIVEDIVSSGAQILFVAISSPIKEIFLHEHKKTLEKVNFIMGVGGSFDVYAGVVKRAPKWMQNIGLEWFFRLLQEPKRMWKRYLVGNTKFIYLVFKEKFKKSKD